MSDYLTPPNVDNLQLTRCSPWMNSYNGPAAWFKGRYGNCFYYTRYFVEKNKIDQPIIIGTLKTELETGETPRLHVFFSNIESTIIRTSVLRGHNILPVYKFIKAFGTELDNNQDNLYCYWPFTPNISATPIDVLEIMRTVFGGDRVDYLGASASVYGGFEGTIYLHTNPEHYVYDGIISGWKFDSIEDDVIVDSYGQNNGYLIPLSGTDYQLIDGYIDSAVLRDEDIAGESGVLVSNLNGLDFADGSFSIAGHIKTTSPLVYLYQQKSGAYDDIAIKIENGICVVSVEIDGFIYTMDSFTEESDYILLNDGEWHHIAFIFDSSLQEESPNEESTPRSVFHLCIDGEDIKAAYGSPVGSLLETPESLYLAYCAGNQIETENLISMGDFEETSEVFFEEHWISIGWDYNDTENYVEAFVDIGETKTLSQSIALQERRTYRVQIEFEIEEWESGNDEYKLYIYLGNELVDVIDKDTELDSGNMYSLDTQIMRRTVVSGTENLRFVLINLESEDFEESDFEEEE